MTSGSMDEGQLFSPSGERKYLQSSEAKRLLAAARTAAADTRLFCQLLFYTGCRLSEGLAITPRLIDAEARHVVFRTLKRRRLTYRAVPVPARFMRELAAFAKGHDADQLIFPWSRQTGWRRIKLLMDAAGIVGCHATPKGLRHQFGCHAISRQIPESAVGRWLGHASSKSTRIYTFVVDAEERALARRMW